MLRLRLRRVGGKKQPSYRIVAADIRSPRNGAFVEVVGHYNPLTNPETVTFKEEQTLHWLREGAQPSTTVARLLTKAGIMEKFNAPKETQTT